MCNFCVTRLCIFLIGLDRRVFDFEQFYGFLVTQGAANLLHQKSRAEHCFRVGISNANSDLVQRGGLLKALAKTSRHD